MHRVVVAEAIPMATTMWTPFRIACAWVPVLVKYFHSDHYYYYYHHYYYREILLCYIVLLTWGNTNRVVSKRVVSKGPLLSLQNQNCYYHYHYYYHHY